MSFLDFYTLIQDQCVILTLVSEKGQCPFN
jgi:hypothetical protein